MPVEVVLIGAAELEEVVAFQRTHVVAKHVVLTIPKPRTRLLRVHVVGSQYLVTRLAQRFQRSVDLSGELDGVSRSAPGPPIAQEVIVKLVSCVGADICGQPYCIEPRYLWSS